MTVMTTAPAPSLLADDQTERLGRHLGFINFKGGVGKTTVTQELGSALARRGRRVLMVDMDPQGNLTHGTAVRLTDDSVTIGQVLDTRVRGGAATAIHACGWDVAEAALIDVIPADLHLRERDLEAAQPGAEKRLARVLYGVTDAYDYTLFDCRPTLGHLEQMVTRALDGDNDGYYLVIEPGHNAVTGAFKVTQELAGWADDMETPITCRGVIVNMYDDGKLHRGVTGALAASLSDPDTGIAPPIMKPFIRRATRIAQLQHMARPSTGDLRMVQEGHLDRFDELAEAVDR
jgi:cellulose biosynthesis protein BcsQ